MRRAVAPAAALIALAACAACAPSSTTGSTEFRPTATLREVMNSVIDPDADFLWDSLSIDATLHGTVKKEPATDEEWTSLRRHAIALVEATNLLLIPGRQVARPGEPAGDPISDRPPEEIQTLITGNGADWTALAHGLQDAAMLSVKAAEVKKVDQLLEAGGALDEACENCHRKYWYRKPPGR